MSDFRRLSVGYRGSHTGQVRARRYPSDTTDAEWQLIEPLLPIPACETSTGGRPEAHERRAIVDAIRYLVDNGCKAGSAGGLSAVAHRVRLLRALAP